MVLLPEAFLLFSETVGSKCKIIEFTAVRLTTNLLWKIPLGGKRPTTQAVLFWLRARVPGKGKDSRGFKKEEKKFQKPFILFLKQLNCPFSLLKEKKKA